MLPPELQSIAAESGCGSATPSPMTWTRWLSPTCLRRNKLSRSLCAWRGSERSGTALRFHARGFSPHRNARTAVGRVAMQPPQRQRDQRVAITPFLQRCLCNGRKIR